MNDDLRRDYESLNKTVKDCRERFSDGSPDFARTILKDLVSATIVYVHDTLEFAGSDKRGWPVSLHKAALEVADRLLSATLVATNVEIGSDPYNKLVDAGVQFRKEIEAGVKKAEAKTD